ncbi:MAG: hypothetical protein ACYCZ7_02735, partial [Minisyncoccota bacterium]
MNIMKKILGAFVITVIFFSGVGVSVAATDDNEISSGGTWEWPVGHHCWFYADCAKGLVCAPCKDAACESTSPSGYICAIPKGGASSSGGTSVSTATNPNSSTGGFDVPRGGSCGATSDCATGLVCTNFICTAENTGNAPSAGGGVSG